MELTEMLKTIVEILELMNKRLNRIEDSAGLKKEDIEINIDKFRDEMGDLVC